MIFALALGSTLIVGAYAETETPDILYTDPTDIAEYRSGAQNDAYNAPGENLITLVPNLEGLETVDPTEPLCPVLTWPRLVVC